jgi:hypothetical protein
MSSEDDFEETGTRLVSGYLLDVQRISIAPHKMPEVVAKPHTDLPKVLFRPSGDQRSDYESVLDAVKLIARRFGLPDIDYTARGLQLVAKKLLQRFANRQR